MSRHGLTPTDAKTTVTIGWDAGLDTYFLTVVEMPADTDDDGMSEEPVVWVGTSLREVTDLGEILRLAANHAVIPSNLRAKLLLDRVNEPHDPLSAGAVFARTLQAAQAARKAASEIDYDDDEVRF